MSESPAAIGRNSQPLRWFHHHAMACDWGIGIDGKDSTQAGHAARAAFDEVDRLERELSRFVESSDVARINSAGGMLWVQLGIDCLECLRLAARIHADSTGAFDVTAPWRSACNPALAGGVVVVPGVVHLEIDATNRRVRKNLADVRVDFGALGKGYAVDRAVEVLREWGVTGGLVHSGQSSLFVIGAPAGASHWKIALRDPRDHSVALDWLELRDESLSGSGVSIHGRHIIDPRTNRPADGPIAAWTAAPTAALSDALSTAFMIMADRDISALCREYPDVRGYWLVQVNGKCVLRTASSESTSHLAGER